MRFLDNRRDGILSLADARRDANIARRGARDQYESDVADFIDNEVTDIENSFMSGGDSNDIPLNIQSPMRIDDFPPDMFVPPEVFDEPIYVPPVDFIDESLPMPPPVVTDPPPVLDDPIPDVFERPPVSRPPDELFISRLDDDDLIGDIVPPIAPPTPPVFTPPTDNVYDDVFTPPPMVNPIIDDDPIIDLPIISPPPFDGIPPYVGGPVDGLPDIGGPPIGGLPSIGAPPYGIGDLPPPYLPPPPDEDEDPPPPKDPIILPPPTPPSGRAYYRPPTDFSSGAPRAQMPIGLSVRSFGQAPGFKPYTPPPIVRPPKPPDRPIRPPKGPGDDIRLPPPDDFLRKATGMSHGGILRLPQSQQGDIMTTRIFQNAFKPRR